MNVGLSIAWLALGAAQPSAVAPAKAETTHGVTVRDYGQPSPRGRQMPPRLRRYLTRDLAYSPTFLDHGVLSPVVAGGWPHLYRVELSLGLLDHLTIGATAHWLPNQVTPRVNPKVAIAFWRARRFEIGAHYFASLYPPPRDDDDPATLSFQRRADWVLGVISFAQKWVTAGLDFGVVRAIEADPAREPDDEGNNPSMVRWRAAGGIHLRAGTRRWGFTASAALPKLYVDFAFDLRFGLFEARPRGGWKPTGIFWSTKRRIPSWRQ